VKAHSLLCSTILGAGVCIAAAESASRPADRRPSNQSANNLYRTPNDVHRLITEVFPDICPPARKAGLATATRKTSPRRQFTSPPIQTEFPFNDLCPSWNIDVPEGSGFYVEVRVGRRAGDLWTPFYYLGGCGKFPAPEKRILKDENGYINCDYFQSSNAFDRIQYRITFFADDPSRPAVLRRFSLAYSNTLNDPAIAAKHRRAVDPGPKDKWTRRLPVPFRSQNWESDALRGHICSPTSLSMVLEYWGVKRPTVEVCERVYDADNHMYGNWWRAVQAAWTYGVPGYLERFGDWNAVKRHIAEGRPIIASTRSTCSAASPPTATCSSTTRRNASPRTGCASIIPRTWRRSGLTGEDWAMCCSARRAAPPCVDARTSRRRSGKGLEYLRKGPAGQANRL